MRILFAPLFFALFLTGSLSCTGSGDSAEHQKTEDKQKVVKKKRDDGTLSTVSQVDDEGFVHGLKVSYYQDGRTVHSKVTFNHGVKQGPAAWYYKTGKIFEHTNFSDGRREGTTQKYYKNGKLLSQCEYHGGDPLPGLIEYQEDGSKITNYPLVSFRKIDKLAFENKVILEISSSLKSNKIKYYHLLDMGDGKTTKSYLETKAGLASLEFFVSRGDVLMRNIDLYAELPTMLGNTLVKKVSYKMAAKNKG